MGNSIYADHAATTKLSTLSYVNMKEYLLEEYANISQPYSFSRKSKKAIRDARETIANCIGAEPDEIYFTSGGTESDNWVLSIFSKKGITTSCIEHHAILNPCKLLGSNGTPINYLKVDYNGKIIKEQLRKMDIAGGSLVSIMFANNEIGTIQDIKCLSQIIHSKNCYFHTDAVQAVGHVDINVKEFGIDYMSASAHKFNGPKGIGFLYVKKDCPLTPFILGGAQESGYRAGTENVASIIGMATALKENIDHMEERTLYLKSLEEIILHNLCEANIPFLRNGINQIPGNLSLSFPNFSGEMILHRLDLMGIYVSTGSACDSKNTQISHVLKAINLDKEFAIGTIRVSLGYDNTESDMIEIVKALKKIVL